MTASAPVPTAVYEDRSMMAHEAETIIPGSFVVLQGNAGDGMSDTITTCPILPEEDDGDDPMQQQQQQKQHEATRTPDVQSSTSEEFQHVHHNVVENPTAPSLSATAAQQQRQPAAPMMLGQLANQKQTTTTTMGIMTGMSGQAAAAAAITNALSKTNSNSNRSANSSFRQNRTPTNSVSGATSPTNDDFIVVSDDQDSERSSSQQQQRHHQRQTRNNDTSNLSQPSSDAKAIDEWKQDCRNREIRQRKDFRESLHQTASALMDHTLIKVYNEQDMWWQSEGRLAIFRDLPTRLHNGTVLRSVMGTLSPGTTIVATDIVYLNAQTLTRIAVNPLLRTSGGMAPHNIFPKGRLGWIQMVRLDLDTAPGADIDGTTTASSSTGGRRSGYACLSLDGYPLMAPGLPSLYTDPHVWIWRVTCPAGAYVREGLALQTQHLDTLPYGSLIRVTRRTINAQGLSRLLIHAVVPDSDETIQQYYPNTKPSSSSSSPNKRWIDGWISEFLNPQSGQRGIVAQPLSFPVPALYRVTLSLGAVIRSDIELSSPQIGIAPMGSVLPVVGRTFSEHPSEKCLERLQLAGNGGWISVRLNRPPPHDDLVVEFVGIDAQFNPDAPGVYHLQAQRAVQAAEADDDDDENGRNQASRHSSGEDLSSIDDDNSGPSDSSQSSPGRGSNNNSSSLLAKKTTYRRGKNATKGNNPQSSSNAHSKDNAKCLICLTEERNATIVHGETGHVACCLVCARILKARGDKCPVCRLEIDLVIQQFWA